MIASWTSLPVDACCRRSRATTGVFEDTTIRRVPIAAGIAVALVLAPFVALSRGARLPAVVDGLPVPPSRPRPPANIEPAAIAPAVKIPTAGPPSDPAAPPRLPPSLAAPGSVAQPAADPGCVGRLAARGIVALPITLPPQVDARCTVMEPVKLARLTLADGSSVVFPDAPTLACITADTFGSYIRELLAPLAKGSYGASVASVGTGPGLECRSRDHIPGAKLSAHGQGLAIDIAQITLGNGHAISVGTPSSDLDRGFETAARAAGCGYFHTVLGPGADIFHKTHWHFDLEPRGSKGNSKFCQ